MQRVISRIVLLSLLILFPNVDEARAQQPIGFDERPSLKLVTPPFSDADIARLTETLDALLSSGARGGTTNLTLWNFARRLQSGRLSPAQEETVIAHLNGLAQQYPWHAEDAERAGLMIRQLTVGKVAPEIDGVDLAGAPLRLTDYRGRVVVLIFGAEWCGICRTMYPYERLMLELYENWPLEVLGIETGSSPQARLEMRSREGLTYRAWWDGPSDQDRGAIASAWNAVGVPTVYLLDADGVIRFVDLRYEDLLKGVRQLLAGHTASASRTASLE